MEKSRKEKSLIVLTLLMLLIVVVGATYAYFAAQKGTGGSANIEVGAGTTDSLTFQAGNAINITASADDFYQGADDKTGNSTATATLVPNNTTNEATDYYNVYFIIDENDFTYSTDDEQVELLLKITDPDGEAVTNIDALAYNQELQGFDITKRKRAFKVALKDEIKATDINGFSEEWQIEVILRNLEADQQKNTGKTFQGKVLITTDTEDTYIIPELNSITETSKTYDSITVNLLENENHTAEIDKYYYAIEETDEEPATASIMSIAQKLEPTYIEWSEPTYTFTEIDGQPLKENQNYKIYAYFKDVQGTMSEVKTAIVKTDKYNHVTVTGFTSEISNHSIKVTATASAGANPVKDYAFKIENDDVYGEWSDWQTEAEYTFNNLKAGMNYKIQVKARDTLDKESITSYDKEETTTPYTVNVDITGGTSTPESTTVVENGTATFTIAASAGYDITTAKVISGECSLSDNNTMLTVSNVTSDRTCKVVIYQILPLNQYIISKVNTDVGLGTLEKHDANLLNGAQDNSYRYSGNNPNNFVCFGSGSENYNNGTGTCPDTNLYRIIGVFNNQVKLIKSEYIKSTELGIASDGKPSTSVLDNLKRVKVAPSEGFYWNQTADNTWESSTLYQALNNGTSGYLSKLGTTWKNKIATTTWHVGGHDDNMVTPKVMYDAEIKSTPTVSAQIGLMYASDYGFASASSSWTSTLYRYANTGNNNRENNWLYNNVYEWTISPRSNISNLAFLVGNDGTVYHSFCYVDNSAYGVRPSFYLNSDVKIKVDDAIGDVDHPFRIVV